MASKIQLRRDTAANWTTANPVLAQGEAGFETDTKKLKIGNGTDDWTTLTYVSGGSDAWTRAGTVLSPKNAGDQVHTATGKLTVGGTAAAPNIEIKADGGIVANTDGLVYDAATKRLAIGSTTAGATLDVKAAAATTPLKVSGPSSEFARIDTSGRLLVGTSSAVGVYGLQIEQNSGSDPFAGSILLRRGLSNASMAGAGYTLGAISAGSQTNVGGSILFESDAAWGSGDYPTRLVFSTTADGASSPTERMRIGSTGTINFSNVAVYADNAAATTGGLAVGDVYRTSAGQLMIRY